MNLSDLKLRLKESSGFLWLLVGCWLICSHASAGLITIAGTASDPGSGFESRPVDVDPLDLDQIAGFLPKEIKVVDQINAQALIDRITLKIASTPTGKRALCFLAANGTPQNAHDYLHLSDSAADQFIKSCSGVHLTASETANLATMTFRLTASDSPWMPVKKYLLTVSQSGRTPVEGFTTRRNLTLLIFASREVQEAKVLRLFAHEFAITLDQLSRIAYEMETSEWQQGLGVVYNRSERNPPFKPVSNLSQLRCAVRDPYIRYSAALERAFRFEDKIISELGLSKQSPPVAVNAGCSQTLLHWIPLVPALVGALDYEAFKYQLGECALSTNVTHSVFNHIKVVRDTNLTFAPGVSAAETGKGLCSLILEPHVGAIVPDLDRGGPRPRVGGWDPESDVVKVDQFRNDLQALARTNGLAGDLLKSSESPGQQKINQLDDWLNTVVRSATDGTGLAK